MPRFLVYDLVQRTALSPFGMLGLTILASSGDKELRKARSVEKEESPLSGRPVESQGSQIGFSWFNRRGPQQLEHSAGTAVEVLQGIREKFSEDVHFL